MRTKSAISAYVLIMLACCTICFSSVQAQQKNELVYRHSGFGLLNKKYFLGDVKTSKRSVGELLERENKEAYKVFKSAKATSVAGAVIAGVSGVLLIVGIGQLGASDFGDANEKSGLLIAGVAGITGGVILVIVANNKFKKAAAIYNQSNSSTGKINLNFGLTRTGGVGLMLSL